MINLYTTRITGHMLSPEEQERALLILRNMALERTGWRSWLQRWVIADEPLRNDAANFIRSVGYQAIMPMDTRLVGDSDG